MLPCTQIDDTYCPLEGAAHDASPVLVPKEVLLPGTQTDDTNWELLGAEHVEMVNVPLMDADPTERYVPGL